MSCHPHYIRCIRPNTLKAPKNVDMVLTMNQVQYLGLAENVRVRRAGFVYRETFAKFYRRFVFDHPLLLPLIPLPFLIWKKKKRFACILKNWPKQTVPNEKEGVKAILDECKFTSAMYAFGKTKIFIRNPQNV